MGIPLDTAPTPMAATPPAVVEAVPAQPAAPEILSPLVITGTQPVPVAPVPAPGILTDNSIVSGFAKSVPLAVALRQILPAGYAFSIDPDVDMGTLVSFKGGRPWRDTLRDALAPAGLVTREQGQMIAVGYGVAPALGAAIVKTPAYRPGMEPKSLVLANPAPVVTAPAVPAPVVPAPGILTPAPLVPAAPLVPVPPPLADNSIITPLPEEVIHMETTPVPGVAMTESWTAERGQNLRKVLEDWSRRANVELNWLSEYDYPVQASVSLTGTFENAVRTLLVGFENARPQPIAELHSNANMGQMVLVVRARGNTENN